MTKGVRKEVTELATANPSLSNPQIAAAWASVASIPESVASSPKNFRLFPPRLPHLRAGDPMANQANIDALSIALLKSCGGGEYRPAHRYYWLGLAKRLAARAVLVPSATNTDGALEAFDAFYEERPMSEVMGSLRAVLERIARGDA